VSQDGLSVNKKADAVKYIDLDVINKKIDHRLSMDANFMFATNESSARTTSVFTALADNFDTRANANIKYQASAKIGNVNLSVDSAVVSGRNAGFDEDESVNLDKLYLSLSAEDTFKIEAGIVKPHRRICVLMPQPLQKALAVLTGMALEFTTILKYQMLTLQIQYLLPCQGRLLPLALQTLRFWVVIILTDTQAKNLAMVMI
jgi:hypothetical protein